MGVSLDRLLKVIDALEVAIECIVNDPRADKEVAAATCTNK